MGIINMLVKIDELDRDNLQMNEALDYALMKLVNLRRKYGKLTAARPIRR